MARTKRRWLENLRCGPQDECGDRLTSMRPGRLNEFMHGIGSEGHMYLRYTICTLDVPKVSTENPALSLYVDIEHNSPTVGKEGTPISP